jgi:mRNA-degrading endonuclease toxin of MazEF toxin-antitoxin module
VAVAKVRGLRAVRPKSWVSQVSTLDRRHLLEQIGSLPAPTLREVEDGLWLVLGL